MNRIAIYGAGGFGREVAMLIEQINRNEEQWEIAGYYDDGMEVGTVVGGYKVLGNVHDLNKVQRLLHLVFAIADPKVKRELTSIITNTNIRYPALIHPDVLVEKGNVVGEGTIITAGNILTVNVNIGCHVILNLACTVGHDTAIKDFSSVMPGCNISGEVEIAQSVFVGTGAKILNRVKIGENSIIGAGAVVVNSIPDNCTAVGVPAKPIKYHN